MLPAVPCERRNTCTRFTQMDIDFFGSLGVAMQHPNKIWRQFDLLSKSNCWRNFPLKEGRAFFTSHLTVCYESTPLVE
jgi:hypothetical protein